MNIENLSTLKIHKLTQAQYDRELEADRIDPTAFYLTPDKTADELWSYIKSAGKNVEGETFQFSESLDS